MAGTVAERAIDERRVEPRVPSWMRSALMSRCAVSRRTSAALVAAAACLLGVAGDATAQETELARCDSIVGAARRDSVASGLYFSVNTPDIETTIPYRQGAASAVANGFVPPRPFRLSVFAGAPQMRAFRRMGADTSTELRAPTLTGVYRFSVPREDSLAEHVVRASLMPGFDSAVFDAIRSAVIASRVFQPPPGLGSVLFELRVGTDSVPGAIKAMNAWFPRMPVKDALPKPDNPPARFPLGAQDDSTRRFDVSLRFVVDRDGAPALETVEVVRATSSAFLREAFAALPTQRFMPARIDGCPVAQVVTYAFTFVVPRIGSPPRH